MIDDHDGDDDHHDDYDHDNFQETQKSSVEDNIQIIMMMITINVITGDPEEQRGGQHPDGGSQTILPTRKPLLCQVRCNQ